MWETVSHTYLFLLGPIRVNEWDHVSISQNDGLINYIFPLKRGFYMGLSLMLLKRKQNKEIHVMQCYLLHGFFLPLSSTIFFTFHSLKLLVYGWLLSLVLTLIDFLNPSQSSNIFKFTPSSKLQLLKSMRPTKPSSYTWVDIPVDLCGNGFLLPLIPIHIYAKWWV